MSFLRTLLMFIFVFSLVGVSGSYAGKISNCSNCDKDKLSKLRDLSERKINQTEQKEQAKFAKIRSKIAAEETKERAEMAAADDPPTLGARHAHAALPLAATRGTAVLGGC